MKKSLFGLVAIATSAAMADIQVYRMERDTETEQIYVVGVDGVRRPMVLVEPFEYAVLTGQVDKVWKSLNKTLQGRQNLHGRIINTTVANGVKVETHEDGYRHCEELPEKHPRRKGAPINASPHDTLRSARHNAYRERLKAAKAAKPREVTVEHDAATGKDVVK